MRFKRVRRVLSLAWPLALAVLFIPFGADAALGWVVLFGLRGFWFFAIPCIVASIDLTFWYWFFGWAGAHIANARKVREAVNEFKADGLPLMVKDAFEDAKTTGLRIWEWLTDYVEGNVQPKSKFKRWVRDAFLGLISGMPRTLLYLLIFILPVIPLIGMYIGITIARAAKLKYGLPVLLVGNVTKICLWSALVYTALR